MKKKDIKQALEEKKKKKKVEEVEEEYEEENEEVEEDDEEEEEPEEEQEEAPKEMSIGILHDDAVFRNELLVRLDLIIKGLSK